MTPQEMFNRAYLGVIAQGRPSVTSTGTCCYYDSDGGIPSDDSNVAMCGIGHVLGKELAFDWAAQLRGSLDDIRASCINVDEELDQHTFKEEVPDYIRDNWDLAEQLQCAHDSAANDVGIIAGPFSTTDWPEHMPTGFIPIFKMSMELIAKHHQLTIPALPDEQA